MLQGLQSTDGQKLLDPLSLSDCKQILPDTRNVLIVTVRIPASFSAAIPELH